MRFRNVVRGSVAIGALVGSMLLAQPALAKGTEGNEPDKGRYVQVEMTGVPVTASNAVEYGFEVRTDATGVQYAVHPDTPEGDFSHAVRIVPEPEPGQVTPFNTVYGNCGYSWLYFNSKTHYKTGYQIYTSYGYTISWDWQVTLKSSIDLHYNSFGGLFATQRWDVPSYAHGAQALGGSTMSAFASGNVLTSGGICSSGMPTATVKW
jgi:hypothetical protein